MVFRLYDGEDMEIGEDGMDGDKEFLWIMLLFISIYLLIYLYIFILYFIFFCSNKWVGGVVLSNVLDVF